MQASRVTLPSRSGNPPYPTDLSFGSSSESLTPYSTAVKPPSPFFNFSQATLFAFTPWFHVEIILGTDLKSVRIFFCFRAQQCGS